MILEATERLVSTSTTVAMLSWSSTLATLALEDEAEVGPHFPPLVWVREGAT